MPRTLLALPLLALVACADADQDGLSDARERELGTDPKVADSDGDGMLDGDEVELGVDPALWDTDGDGYSDFQEIDFGSDPNDAESGVYEGGWPYNPFKDGMVDPGLEGRPSMGDPIGRFVALDQFGEEVDIYDFAQHGKPVLIDLSALWCPPCRQLSKWMAGEDVGGYGAYDPVRQAVADGDLLWVTVIAENNQGGWPHVQDVQWWDEQFTNPEIAVLADSPEINVGGYFHNAFYPSLYLLDENLQLLQGPSAQSFVPPLNAARTMIGD